CGLVLTSELVGQRDAARPAVHRLVHSEAKMSFGSTAFAALVLIAPGAVFGQTPAVDYVQTESGPISPGDRASVFCRNLSDLPATVQVGDRPAPVFSREPWIDD